MRVGIYKDTLANRRGADFAVLALAEGPRERGHDAVVFEKGDFGKRMAEAWDVVVSTGTNELIDLSNCFSRRPARTAPFPVPRFPFPIIQQFHTNPKSQLKWKRFVRNWKIRRALRRVSAIQVLSEDFVPQVEKYCANVVVIGNWSGFNHVERVEHVDLRTSNSQLPTTPPASVPQLAHTQGGVCGTNPPAHERRRIAADRSLKLPALGGGLRRKAESPAEARFTSPNQNCYNTDNKQESFVSTGLRNECCTGYWMAGAICLMPGSNKYIILAQKVGDEFVERMIAWPNIDILSKMYANIKWLKYVVLAKYAVLKINLIKFLKKVM